MSYIQSPKPSNNSFHSNRNSPKRIINSPDVKGSQSQTVVMPKFLLGNSSPSLNTSKTYEADKSFTNTPQNKTNTSKFTEVSPRRSAMVKLKNDSTTHTPVPPSESLYDSLMESSQQNSSQIGIPHGFADNQTIMGSCSMSEPKKTLFYDLEGELSLWILVIGFPCEILSEVIERFQTFGKICFSRTCAGANWIFLKYPTAEQAQRASHLNGLMIKNSILITVVVCSSPGLKSMKSLPWKLHSSSNSDTSYSRQNSVHHPDVSLANHDFGNNIQGVIWKSFNYIMRFFSSFFSV